MATTLKDVALAAGVSTALVSQYLSRSPKARLGEATRRRIDDAVRRLDYRPSPIARSLRSGHSGSIGIAVGNLMNPASALFVNLLLRELRKRNRNLLISTFEPADGGCEAAIVRMLRERLVDGVIHYLPLRTEAPIKMLAEKKAPLFLLRNAMKGALYPHHDAANAFAEAAKLLNARGVRSTAFISQPDLNHLAMTFAATAAAHGLETDCIAVSPWCVHVDEIDRLRRICAQNYDAIICFGREQSERLIHLLETEFPKKHPMVLPCCCFRFKELNSPLVAGALVANLEGIIDKMMDSLIARIDGDTTDGPVVQWEFADAGDFSIMLPYSSERTGVPIVI